jgi:hypothetical protein
MRGRVACSTAVDAKAGFQPTNPDAIRPRSDLGNVHLTGFAVALICLFLGMVLCGIRAVNYLAKNLV